MFKIVLTAEEWLAVLKGESCLTTIIEAQQPQLHAQLAEKLADTSADQADHSAKSHRSHRSSHRSHRSHRSSG
jgi:hypothetical protein